MFYLYPISYTIVLPCSLRILEGAGNQENKNGGSRPSLSALKRLGFAGRFAFPAFGYKNH